MTQIWAHRGASAYAPENTLPAFELAIEQGADGIELDVQRTADGVVVVCHDETLERTSDGVGRVAQTSFADLRRLDFGRPHPRAERTPVPTLAEVLDLVAPTGLVVNVELKNTYEPYPGLEDDVEAVVAASRLGPSAPERVVYSSFNHRSLRLLAERGTRVPLGVLYVEPLIRPWAYAASFGATALHPLHLTILAEEVEAAHAAGLRVHPWTVDAPADVTRVLTAGVDAVITNTPDVARSLRG